MSGAASRARGLGWASAWIAAAPVLLAACDVGGAAGSSRGASTAEQNANVANSTSSPDAGQSSATSLADAAADGAAFDDAPSEASIATDAAPDGGAAPAEAGTDASSSGSSGGTAGYAVPLSAPVGPDFEYTAQVTVGNQSFAMQIDTGSTTAAVAGTGCSGCTGVSPVYTPSSSATDTGQAGSTQYADGSGWSGEIYADTVALGNGSPPVSVDLVDMSMATDNFFSGQNDYQGILGLGPLQNAISGTNGYMPAVLSAGVPSVFAFQLCDGTGSNAGTMWLGGDGSPASTPVYTPLLAISDNNPYYAINVDGMSLGGTPIVTNASNTFQQPILDTGTALFYVPTSVFDAFQTALEASSGFTALFGSNTFATSGANQGCVTDASVTEAQVEAMLPALSLSLPNATGGPDVTIQASALDTYLYDGGGGQFCLAIQDGLGQDPTSVLGDAFLQAFVTIIDLQGGRAGFSPTGCPAPQSHRVRHPKRGPRRGPPIRR
jgi:hypothetical protein